MQIQSGCLRKVTKNDLDLILTWRNSDRVHNNMLTDHIISREEHYAWFDNLDDNTNACMLFKFNSKPAGVVHFYDIADENCYWGFYLGEPDLPRGTGLLLGMLGLNYAFSRLNINTVTSSVLDFNQRSIKFHQKLGYIRDKIKKHSVQKRGQWHDLIIFSLKREVWLQRNSLIEEEIKSKGS